MNNHDGIFELTFDGYCLTAHCQRRYKQRAKGINGPWLDSLRIDFRASRPVKTKAFEKIVGHRTRHPNSFYLICKRSDVIFAVVKEPSGALKVTTCMEAGR